MRPTRRRVAGLFAIAPRAAPDCQPHPGENKPRRAPAASDGKAVKRQAAEKRVVNSLALLALAIWHLPRKLLVAAARVYQWTLSPLVGRQCRFEPTCSNY